MTTPTRTSLTRRSLLKFPLALAGVAALAPLAGYAAELVTPDPPAPVAEPVPTMADTPPSVPADDVFAYFEFAPSRRLEDDEWDYLQDHAERMAEAGVDGRFGGNALLPGDRTLVLRTDSPNPAKMGRIMAAVTCGGIRLNRLGRWRSAGLRPRDLPPFDLTLTATPLNERARRGARGDEGKL